ncbi:putative thioredoxin reductase-like protein 1 [Podospora aff. communis PSN243]|uniref:Thioredoxin reductase-like protein 1 n=1 Tax=Podospora aff. communis PSN243 TaxID=3040156 RepID=A0AAV9GVK9_9PEZI|nr:putative thioredoxin reductase-like protein 1 [Podospora aff. communis PSN243]
MTPYDVLIIGAGPAGLSTAAALARQLHTAVVFDSGVYRNARTKHMHNVPTWDHRDPAEFRAKAREDLFARYETVRIENVAVKRVRGVESGGFEAEDEKGTVWEGRKLVLAVGVEDLLGEMEGVIQGYEGLWGRGVYHCLFCDGYEDRGAASAGVLVGRDVSSAGIALHMARMAKRLSEKVTIYANGDENISSELVDPAEKEGLNIERRKLVRLEKNDGSSGGSGVAVSLEDGTQMTEQFLVSKPKGRVNGPFASQLGLELTEQGFIKVKAPFNEASVKGVFAVGDCASPLPAVVNAMAMGTLAAGGLVAQLQSESTSIST